MQRHRKDCQIIERIVRARSCSGWLKDELSQRGRMAECVGRCNMSEALGFSLEGKKQAPEGFQRPKQRPKRQSKAKQSSRNGDGIVFSK